MSFKLDKDRLEYIKNINKEVVATKNRDLPQYERGVIWDKLYKWSYMYDQLEHQRRIARRCMDYTNGEQWHDKVMTADGRFITEEKNILEQGKIPLKNNMIQVLVNSIVGVFRSNRTEPEARARKRDAQKISDMLSCALQYAHQTNDLRELDAITFREYLQIAFALQSVNYKWIKERNCYDVFVKKYSFFRTFFNGNLEDPRGNDITTIGVLEDYLLDDLIALLARTEEEEERIREIYQKPISCIPSYDALSKDRFDNMTFFTTQDRNLVRVIQCWELETKTRIRCWDKYYSKLYKVEKENEWKIDQENEDRWQQALENGIDYETFKKTMQIQKSYLKDRFWVCYYVSPWGDILFKKESPYKHGESPFVMKLYPLINGEIHSFVENIIDQQRYINRLITLIDFIIGASAKGVLIFPEDALGDMTKEEILEEWTSYNGVIFAKIKPGMPMPQQLSSNSTNIGATELLTLQLRLLTEISGVSGAMQGQAAKSGVSSSMYQQQAMNSQSNILDYLESFDAFRRQRDYKMLKTIVQYYDEPRYSNIAGKNYTEEARNYDPALLKDGPQTIDFDIRIEESQLTPTYRAMMNQFLLQIFQMGKMSVKTLLKASTYPFADEVMRIVDEEERQMMAAQQGQQVVSPQGGTPAADLGNPSAVMNQLSGMADQRAMQMLQQAIA